VTNGHETPKQTWKIIGQMHDRVVLDVGAAADDDAIDVTAQDCVVPNARAIAERDIPNHHRSLRDIDIFSQDGFFAQKCVELIL
jgi:hypothetical protein